MALSFAAEFGRRADRWFFSDRFFGRGAGQEVTLLADASEPAAEPRLTIAGAVVSYRYETGDRVPGATVSEVDGPAGRGPTRWCRVLVPERFTQIVSGAALEIISATGEPEIWGVVRRMEGTPGGVLWLCMAIEKEVIRGHAYRRP